MPPDYPPQDKWDEQTTRIISKVRKAMYMEPPPTISAFQARSAKYTAKNGANSIWAHQDIFPSPTEMETIREAVFDVIDDLGIIEYEKPSWTDVPAEWVTYNTNMSTKALKEGASKKEQFQMLTQTVTSPVIVMYAHGGSFFQGSAEKYRDAAGHLARETGGVCVSINYRLSPQHVFPAALLDLVLVYMSLQFPSADALHSPTPASRIVLAGDSAGANLMFALLKVLLCIQSAERPVTFRGKTALVGCPAAIGCLSLVADQTFALPSHALNTKYDVLGYRTPWSDPNYPACDVWPSRPPRSNIYCHGLSNSHPLVSPTMSGSWKGSPPMWFAYGEEKMIDSGKIIAQQAVADGVVVSWNFYEAMPHCFPLIIGLGGVKHMQEFWNGWGTFFRLAVVEPEKLKSDGVYVPYGDDNEKYHSDIREMITIPNLDISTARGMIEWETKEFQKWFEAACKEKAKL